MRLLFLYSALQFVHNKMHSVILIFCVFLPTATIANQINKYSLEHKIKDIHSKVFVFKSNTDGFKFLTQFGCNPCKNCSDSKPNDYDGPECASSIELMLQAFQTAFHLPITKKLDATILKLMNTPRCGLPDFPSSFVDKSKLW